MEKRLNELIELGNRLPDAAKPGYHEELGEIIGDPMFDPGDDANFSGAFTAAAALGVSPAAQAAWLNVSERTVKNWMQKAPPSLHVDSRLGYVYALSKLLLPKD